MSLLPPRTTAPPTPEHVEPVDVLALTDPAAIHADITGAKAAALARAGRAGLPIVPGVVLTSRAVSRLAPGLAGADSLLDTAWRRARQTSAEAATGPLVVRSSSTVEDQGSSSMAGLFHSVLGVDTPDAFTAAVADVVDSARSAAVTAVAGDTSAPMAVLVQRQIDAVIGGVLFGADPVSGRTDRLVISASPGTPDALVSGQVNGSQITIDRRGRVVGQAGDPAPAEVDANLRRRFVALADATARIFGGPQDMEWALDAEGALWLLQSRPITTVNARPAARVKAKGPVWGPGPVAETFPVALRRLEADLWVAPLAEGLEHALRLTGAIPASRRRHDTPVVRTVGGWVVADLGRLGSDLAPKGSFLRKLDPRPPSWRLRVAWRVGRLKLAVGAIGRDVVLAADTALAEVPEPRALDDAALIGTLLAAQRSLVSLHAHEALAGMLIDSHEAPATSSVVAAHRALAAGRAEGWSDDEIIAREPSVLALVTPSIPPRPHLPATADLDELAPRAVSDTDAAVVREALRLRIRWTHELTAHLAVEAGRRLVERAALPSADVVGDVGLPELLDALRARRPCPIEAVPTPHTAPPPDAFRLGRDGAVVALPRRGDAGTGLGAGGGRGTGVVWDLADGAPPAGAVLVTRFLEPGLAAYLPGLNGLVAETGSVLSHLAIVARELGVPTVVAASGAIERYPAGTHLLVDGTTGELAARTPVSGDAQGGAR